ncbi:MAG: hypothetical protein ACRCVI_01755 [Mycoplasmoidaceae bacterium]
MILNKRKIKNSKKQWWKKGIMMISISSLVAIPLLTLTHGIQNNSNIQNKVSRVVDIKSSDDQIEIFNSIENNIINNIIAENNLVDMISNGNSRFSRNGIEIDIEEELINHINAVKNGDILISDIEDQMVENIHIQPEYSDQYDELRQDIFNYNSIINDEKDLLLETYYEETPLRQLRSSNDITIDDIYRIQEFIKYINDLNELKTREISFSSVSTGLTLVSWGVAAFYWSCWWMFGGNVPFALAATLQAVTMTASAAYSIYSAVETSNSLAKIDEILSNQFIRDFNRITKDLVKPKIGTPLSSEFIAYVQKVISDISALTWTSLVISVSIELLTSSSKIKTIFKIVPVLKNGIKFQTSNRLIIWGTKWANPVGAIIGILDAILMVASDTLCNDIVRKLESYDIK